MLTPRDTFTLLTKTFGEHTTYGRHALPDNWAADNPTELEEYVDMTNVNAELATFLGIQPTVEEP